jgi:formiminotetrahydrofolate cyclodeaminase
MSLIKLTIEDFIEQLASASPTPGGGSASALAGAMAAAMVEMTCNLTVGREKFRDVEDRLKVVLARAGELRAQLVAAVDEDTAAYDEVSQAYKMRKETDAEKAARSEAIQKALMSATQVPLRVAKAAMETAQLAQIALEDGNPNVASDALVARLLADAARAGAVVNVEINLSSLKDFDYVTSIEEELRDLQA